MSTSCGVLLTREPSWIAFSIVSIPSWLAFSISVSFGFAFIDLVFKAPPFAGFAFKDLVFKANSLAVAALLIALLYA